MLTKKTENINYILLFVHRSSGESELSVGGTKEKKDKKGVFGGLFSRKKRPQSHM